MSCNVYIKKLGRQLITVKCQILCLLYLVVNLSLSLAFVKFIIKDSFIIVQFLTKCKKFDIDTSI